MSSPLFLDLPLELPARGRLDALHRQLRQAIVDGRLPGGAPLPASRTLAALAGVSRATATAAYERLVAEGYLLARGGSGTSVAPLQPGAARGALAPGTPPAPPRHRLREAAEAALADVPLAPAARFDLRPGRPDPRAFPFAAWRRAEARAWRTIERDPLAEGDVQGEPTLREAIARHVAATRAVACTAAEVLVTAGAQQAFELLARVLTAERGRTVVAVENPGYRALGLAFAEAGARIEHVEVDAEGLRVDRLPARVDVIGVSPSHQFPLGVTMSAARRAALLAHARASDAIVIEDDYDGEFRHAGRALDALQTLDHPAERVFYVGTFSKTTLQALRVGFVVAPPWAREALAGALRRYNWRVPLATQRALAGFIAEGELARHVRRMRHAYARRQQAMLQAIERHLAGALRPYPPLAGMHLCAAVDPALDAAAWAARARAAGVMLESLAPYTHAPLALNGLVMGYGLIDAERIDAAVRALARVMPPRR